METVMNEINMLDAVERYIRGEMNPDERLQFENLRKTSPETDQLVVEHTLFLQQLNQFGERKNLKSSLNETHTRLTEEGNIDSMRMKGGAKVVYLWKRYRRVATIAASIAGITALTISALVWAFAPKNNSQTEVLGRKLEQMEKKQQVSDAEVIRLKNQLTTKPIEFKSGGTGFMIDGKGYIVTNAHIVRKSKNVYVLNHKGDEFRARIIKMIPEKDLAILKIEDDNFKPVSPLPYTIRKSSTDVAEPVYTLGYPRNDIVYSEGYLSAKTGFNGDTLTCQLGIAANRGNSGGPVFNQEGEVIGVISARDVESQGVTFAIQSKYIFDAIDQLKKDTSYQSLKLPARSAVKGMNKKDQVKKIQDYVFMVKGD
jgi:S1-C subfamily serine protease